MKAINTIVVLSIVAVLAFSSCNIEKRRYRKGYNITKDKDAPKSDVRETKAEPEKPAEQTKIATVTQSKPEKKAKVVQPKPQKIDTKASTEYSFQIVVGPRPDKKKIQAKHKPR